MLWIQHACHVGPVEYVVSAIHLLILKILNISLEHPGHIELPFNSIILKPWRKVWK